MKAPLVIALSLVLAAHPLLESLGPDQPHSAEEDYMGCPSIELSPILASGGMINHASVAGSATHN